MEKQIKKELKKGIIDAKTGKILVQADTDFELGEWIGRFQALEEVEKIIDEFNLEAKERGMIISEIFFDKLKSKIKEMDKDEKTD